MSNAKSDAVDKIASKARIAFTCGEISFFTLDENIV